MQLEKGTSEIELIEDSKTKKIVLKKEEDQKESKKHYLALKLPKKVTWSEDKEDNEGKAKKNLIYFVYIIDLN